MSIGSIYNVAVTSAFTQGVNVLPSIRSAIGSAYSIDEAHQAKIVAVDMRSATTFTVSFGAENSMTAELLASGEYGVRYVGGIDRIVFGGDTGVTLTWLRVEWAHSRADYGEATFTIPDGMTLTVKNGAGQVVIPTDTLQYDLAYGATYYYTLAGTGSSGEDVPFVFNGDTVKIS